MGSGAEVKGGRINAGYLGGFGDVGALTISHMCLLFSLLRAGIMRRYSRGHN